MAVVPAVKTSAPKVFRTQIVSPAKKGPDAASEAKTPATKPTPASSKSAASIIKSPVPLMNPKSSTKTIEETRSGSLMDGNPVYKGPGGGEYTYINGTKTYLTGMGKKARQKMPDE